MIRATTGGVMNSYRSNLMSAFIGMNSARNTVLSQRTFNSYAEDPAAAAKAFRLRKSRLTVDSQHDICNDVLKKYDSAYACLQSIDEVLDTKGGEYGAYMKTLKGTTLSWLNDPSGDAREQLSKVLDQTSDLITQTMNQKYGDNFIFAGADGHNVPFEVKTVDGSKKLYYRGVPVDAAVPNVMTWTDPNGNEALVEFDPDTGAIAQGTGTSYIKQPIPSSAFISMADYDPADPDYQGSMPLATDPTANPPEYVYFDADGNQVDSSDPAFVPTGYYILDTSKVETMTTEEYDAACKDAEKLEYLANEKHFVDIGLGFQEDENGNLIESSGFNAALPGISFLGYGVDEDGDPKNIYSIVQRLTEISDSVPEGGSWDAVWPEFDRLVGKLETACSSFKTEFTNLAAGTTKLENQEQLLVDNFDNLQEQYAALEDVDMVDSITSFIWAEYCYNAALKVGNSILSESLMDYLN